MSCVRGALMSQRRMTRRIAGRNLLVATLALAAAASFPRVSLAAEGGVTFWVPGFFGSLASTPLQPGFSYTSLYYNWTGQAGADVAFARQVQAGRLTVPFTANVSAHLDANASLYFAIPSYTFEQKIFGAQATMLLLVPYGRATAAVDATLTAALGPFGFAIGGYRSDGVTGFADLVPQFNLRWNSGVHNVMTYITGNVPIGRYDDRRLANLGLGYQALDGGIGYTYFDPKAGLEFSGTLGFTYNFKNEHTDYQSGPIMHFDWGASRFLTPQVQVGLVGYVLQQIGCDSGGGDRVGCFESRVAGIGPQFGYIIPFDKLQGYFNLKAYKEFAGEHRADGFSVWATFSIGPAAPTPSSAGRPMMK